jgi:hypothetical protein
MSPWPLLLDIAIHSFVLIRHGVARGYAQFTPILCATHPHSCRAGGICIPLHKLCQSKVSPLPESEGVHGPLLSILVETCPNRQGMIDFRRAIIRQE